MTVEKQNGIDVSDIGIISENNYRRALLDVSNSPTVCENRTGENTLTMEFVTTNYLLIGGSIPLLDMKKIFTRSLLVELEWYFKGMTNIKFLNDNKVSIWDQWADENGDLGPVYGKQWRDWVDTKIVTPDESEKLNLSARGYKYEGSVKDSDKIIMVKHYDQMQMALDKLRNNPDDRRIIITAWNVGEIDDMKLPPCHAFWQLISRPLSDQNRLALALTLGKSHIDHNHESKFSRFYNGYNNGVYTLSDEELDALFKKHDIPTRRLSSALYQRSVDTFIGMPFNIAGYSIMTHFMAQISNHFPESFVHFGGDFHLYCNHIEQASEYLGRSKGNPSAPKVLLPETWSELDDFNWQEIKIVDYDPLDAIKAPVAK